MNVLMPFVIGAVIAYILKPSCNLIEKKISACFENHDKSPKAAPALSIMITVILAVVIISALLIMVVPTLLESIYSVMLLVPDRLTEFSDWLIQYVGDNETLNNYINSISESLSTSVPEWLTQKVIPNLQTMAGSVANGVVGGVSGIVNVVKNFLIGIIAAIYILMSRRKFAAQAKKINYGVFGEKWSNIILEEVRYADKVFSGFINGRLIDSLIIGVICFVGMMILRMPYAVLISVIVGVTNIIPFFGPYIGAVPSFLLVLMVDPMKSVVFLVFILILQQFDGNILGPRILGDVTGLSGFWVLFSILVFGGYFGFIGLLIGVPVFAVIYDVIRKLVDKLVRWRKNKEQDKKNAGQESSISPDVSERENAESSGTENPEPSKTENPRLSAAENLKASDMENSDKENGVLECEDETER